MRLNFTDAYQQAYSFLRAQTAIIEPQVIQTVYPDIQYPNLVPIDTAGDEWAQTIVYISQDSFGQAEWFHHMAHDVPVADIQRQEHQVNVEMLAIGYHYTVQELQQTMRVPGLNLPTERANAARRIYEEKIDDLVLRGSTEKGYTGLINQSGAVVTIGDAPADGAAAATTWASKTVDQVLRDFNSPITGMWTASLNIELADTVLLPYSVLIDLSQRQLTGLDMSLLDWIKERNMYTFTTGRPLTIRGVRGLETAASDGSGRMVAYRNDPMVLKFYLPMRHRFLEIWRTAPMVFHVPGVFRVGGLNVRRPGGVRYLDKIAAAPA